MKDTKISIVETMKVLINIKKDKKVKVVPVL
jgi:hypothetical protein